MGKIKLFAVLGPTASGKTELAARLAEALHGEVVSCDSMQVYRGMDIGTAKPSEQEMRGVPHHLIGCVSPEEKFSVMDYVTLAKEKVREVEERGNRVFLAGGTGHYARALLCGLPFSEHGSSEELRQALWDSYEANGIRDLYDELRRLDPKAAEGIHPNNTKRVLRALEYCRITGERFSSQAERSLAVEPPYDSKNVILGFRDRETLYRRIDRRVDEMMERGLLEEARGFWESHSKGRGTAAQAIGYKELFPFFAGEISLEEAVDRIKLETRHFAKRQLTWFRREQDAQWIFVDDYESGTVLFEAVLPLAGAHFEGRIRP